MNDFLFGCGGIDAVIPYDVNLTVGVNSVDEVKCVFVLTRVDCGIFIAALYRTVVIGEGSRSVVVLDGDCVIFRPIEVEIENG